MHRAFGGVVPELASRDHVERVLPLLRQVLDDAGIGIADIDAHRLHAGSGAGRRAARRREHRERTRVCARQARDRRPSSRRPSAVAACSDRRRRRSRLWRCSCPAATRSSSRWRRSGAIGCSAIRSTTLPARRSTRRHTCSVCRIRAGRRSRHLPKRARPGAVALPRPMLDSGNLDVSFSGLKTAVALRLAPPRRRRRSGKAFRRQQGRHRTRVPGGRRRRAGREIDRRHWARPGCRHWSSPGASARIASCAHGLAERSSGAAVACSFRSRNTARTTAR